jgi:anthranilate 1,2-dioxygenase large subunit
MVWQPAVPLSALAQDRAVGVKLDGKEVALYLLDGTVYATHGICTHALAFLTDGFVENGEVECPLHQGRFDIRTGKALCAPVTRDLPTYAVEIREDTVWVDLAQPGRSHPAVACDKTASTAVPAAQPRHVVVLGAGQAAAAAIRAMRAAGFAGPVTLVGEEPHLPYERPPLSKEALHGEDFFASDCLTEEDVRSLGIAPLLARRATALDAEARRVTLQDGEQLRYDALLLATGGRARRLSVSGADLPGVFHLRSRDDAAAIAAALRRAQRVVVVGGGFIGLELAAAARRLDLAVTVLEQAPGLMGRLLPVPLGRAFRQLAERNGVEVRTGVAVTGIERHAGALLVAAGADRLEADVVLVGIGLEPAVDLAQQAGCALLAGAIRVDPEGRTGVPGIWAAGDCAAHPVAIAGRALRLESWQNAEDAGAAAGRSIAGAPAIPGRTPWFWSDQFGVNIQMLGVPHPSDRVARSGQVYRTVDEAGAVTATIAFGDAAAIRAARSGMTLPDQVEWLFEAEEDPMDTHAEHRGLSLSRRYVWPAEGLTKIPDWVYTDQWIYEREVERIFKGRTWNYVALESEVANPGDYIRSHVGPVPVVVSRAEDGSINVFENRCSHRAAEFCRELRGTVKEFVCPYHQWTYDLKGNLQGVPFRRGAAGKGGMPADFRNENHGPRRLNVTTHRGAVFASYADEMESLQDYFGPEILREFEATFDGRKLVVLGHYRHTLPGNWKLYHENLKDPYHATLLHTFLVAFGLLVAGNRSLMLADATGRHGVMCSAKSDPSKIAAEDKKEMRAFHEGMRLEDPRLMDFVDEFDSPWSVTMATIWPNLIVQREMNTLGIRQIVPTGPNEFIMKWTMFGFEGDTPEMTAHRLRQGNLMGPAGFLGLEDNEAMKFVQDGMLRVPDGEHYVGLDPETPFGTSETLISESAIRGMYRHWREVMGI